MKRQAFRSGRMAFAVAALFAAFLACTLQPAEAACRRGDEGCPVVLKMRPGTVSVTGRGSVTGGRPNFYFKFDARSGQKLIMTVVGRNLKTGPGVPVTLPNGGSDAVDVGTAYTLPQTGSYVFVIHANTMAEGPFGPFRVTLRIR